MLPTHMFLELDTIYLPRRGCSFDAIQVAVPTISEGSVALNSIPPMATQTPPPLATSKSPTLMSA